MLKEAGIHNIYIYSNLRAFFLLKIILRFLAHLPLEPFFTHSRVTGDQKNTSNPCQETHPPVPGIPRRKPPKPRSEWPDLPFFSDPPGTEKQKISGGTEVAQRISGGLVKENVRKTQTESFGCSRCCSGCWEWCSTQMAWVSDRSGA